MNPPVALPHVARPVSGAGLVLAVSLLLATPPAAPAVPPQPRTVTASVPAGVAFADSDGWGVRKLVNSTNRRSRVIQIAAVSMCLGLFILMRKLTT